MLYGQQLDHQFTAALQPVFLYQKLITVFIKVSENGGPLAHKITL
jgi:hypothetical protein